MTHRLVWQISFKWNSFRSDSLWTDHNLILYCRWKTPSSLMRSTALLRPLSCWLHMPSRPSMVTTRERFTLPASYPQTDSSQRGSCNSTSFRETSGKTGTLQTTSKDKFKGRRCQLVYFSLQLNLRTCLVTPCQKKCRTWWPQRYDRLCNYWFIITISTRNRI